MHRMENITCVADILFIYNWVKPQSAFGQEFFGEQLGQAKLVTIQNTVVQ